MGNLTPLKDLARLGGLSRAAQYDGLEVTAKARETFAASFLFGHECKLCPPVGIPAELPRAERERRAGALRAAHFERLRIRSAEARAAKAATS